VIGTNTVTKVSLVSARMTDISFCLWHNAENARTLLICFSVLPISICSSFYDNVRKASVSGKIWISCDDEYNAYWSELSSSPNSHYFNVATAHTIDGIFDDLIERISGRLEKYSTWAIFFLHSKSEASYTRLCFVYRRPSRGVQSAQALSKQCP